MAVWASVLGSESLLGMSIAAKTIHKDSLCVRLSHPEGADSYLTSFWEYLADDGSRQSIESPVFFCRSTNRAERAATKPLPVDFAVSLSNRAEPNSELAGASTVAGGQPGITSNFCCCLLTALARL